MKIMSYVLGCLLIGQTGFAKTKTPAFILWQLSGQTGSQMNSYVIRRAGDELIIIDGGYKEVIRRISWVVRPSSRNSATENGV